MDEKSNFNRFRFEEIMTWFLINNSIYRGTIIPLLKESYFDKAFSVEKAVYECIKFMMGDDKIKNDDFNYDSLWINLSESGLDKESLDKISNEFEILILNEDKIRSGFSIDVMFEKTEEWIRSRALKNAVYEAAYALDTDNSKKIAELPSLFSEALNIRIDDSENMDIAESVEERYWMRKDNTNKIPFLINKFNLITKNGLPRKSLSCFTLPTGGGKTAIFCSLAADYLREGYNVLFITLELAKEIVETRIDANITNTSIDELEQMDLTTYLDKCKENYGGKGRIIVKEFPTSSVNTSAITTLLTELKQKKGFVPDILIVDYINLINPTRHCDTSSYIQIKSVAEELRGICVKNNLVGITGTQVNRDGIKNGKIELTDTSESMGLPFTLDFMISGFATKEQREDNLIAMTPTKNRFSGYVNNMILLELNFDYMRLRDLPESNEKNYNSYNGQTATKKKSKESKEESSQISSSIKTNNGFNVGMRPLR